MFIQPEVHSYSFNYTFAITQNLFEIGEIEFRLKTEKLTFINLKLQVEDPEQKAVKVSIVGDEFTCDLSEFSIKENQSNNEVLCQNKVLLHGTFKTNILSQGWNIHQCDYSTVNSLCNIEGN